jgi:hypothetical protein
LTVLLRQRRAIRGTTLVSPWCWALAALATWSFVELLFAADPANLSGLTPWRLAAIVLSLCPVVSLIGAKRPQHTAWNFVVLALWCILTLPAAESAVLHPGQKLIVGDARGWLLWILILLGPINFVPTRYWLAALLVATGQGLALSRHLPPVARPLVGQPEVAGLALCGLGMIAAAIACRRKTVAANPYDVLWLDFRDSFGLFWSLRVQERINAAANQNGWNLELTWSGFGRKPEAPAKQNEQDPSLALQASMANPALRTALKGLLRRFVSHEWIAARLGSTGGQPLSM